MSQPAPVEVWYEPAMRLMLEEGCSLEMAAAALGIPEIAPIVAGNIMRRKGWRDLWADVNRDFYNRRSSPTEHSKGILVGRMLDNAQRLAARGDLKEASDVLGAVAKIEGWTGADTTTNIFQNLAGADYDTLRALIGAKKS